MHHSNSPSVFRCIYNALLHNHLMNNRRVVQTKWISEKKSFRFKRYSKEQTSIIALDLFSMLTYDGILCKHAIDQ